MSSFIARVLEIQNTQNLNIVKFDFHGETLSMMSLDLNKDIKVGVEVKLVVKPTHILLAKEFNGEISCSNRLPASVISLENGKLLSSVKLRLFESELESIVTRDASNTMNLKVGDEVMVLIPQSELSIGETIDA